MATPPSPPQPSPQQLNIADDEVFDEDVVEELPVLSEVELESILTNYQTTNIVKIVSDDELTNLLQNWGHLELLDHFKSKLKLYKVTNFAEKYTLNILSPFNLKIYKL